MIVCPSCTEEALVPSGGDEALPAPASAGSTAATKDLPLTGKAAVASALPSRPVDSAYAPKAARSHQPLFEVADHRFDDEEHSDDEHDDDEAHPPHKKKRFMDDTIDMTAMVDVTFLLLIFFMVTASFAAQKVFETSPPEQEGEGGGGAAVSSVEDLESSSVIIEIDAHDQMEIEGQQISGLFALREVLASKMTVEGKNELLIQAQYEATHGIVVSVTDAAMDAGMQNVRRISRKSDD